LILTACSSPPSRFHALALHPSASHRYLIDAPAGVSDISVSN
jgi:hypothetical protein